MCGISFLLFMCVNIFYHSYIQRNKWRYCFYKIRSGGRRYSGPQLSWKLKIIITAKAGRDLKTLREKASSDRLIGRFRPERNFSEKKWPWGNALKILKENYFLLRILYLAKLPSSMREEHLEHAKAQKYLLCILG